MPEPNKLYTIGYSGFFNLEDFLACLKANKIGALVDARGYPEIASFEQYKGANLKKSLNARGIHYLSFAREFGARPTENKYYTDNIVDFGKIAASQPFLHGCERIRNGLGKFNICLMCAEKDPAVCHRSILITHQFEKIYPEIAIRHILPDAIKSQKDIDEDLRKRYALFESCHEACYRLHGKAIAYKRK